MDRLITQCEPPTWEALEEAVRQILAECGMDAVRQAPVALPRGGEAAVDVMATEIVNGIKTTTLCECKNWKTNVTQDVVFSFRTVMAEAGAHRGYVMRLRHLEGRLPVGRDTCRPRHQHRAPHLCAVSAPVFREVGRRPDVGARARRRQHRDLLRAVRHPGHEPDRR